jgi:hypothetical protein
VPVARNEPNDVENRIMLVSRTVPPIPAVIAWLFLLRQDVKFNRLNVQRLRRQNWHSAGV